MSINFAFVDTNSVIQISYMHWIKKTAKMATRLPIFTWRLSYFFADSDLDTRA